MLRCGNNGGIDTSLLFFFLLLVFIFCGAGCGAGYEDDCCC